MFYWLGSIKRYHMRASAPTWLDWDVMHFSWIKNSGSTNKVCVGWNRKSWMYTAPHKRLYKTLCLSGATKHLHPIYNMNNKYAINKWRLIGDQPWRFVLSLAHSESHVHWMVNVDLAGVNYPHLLREHGTFASMSRSLHKPTHLDTQSPGKGRMSPARLTEEANVGFVLSKSSGEMRD